ncbi:MAG: hypothetical protein AB1679_09335 [Actinomycetota bacterium]
MPVVDHDHVVLSSQERAALSELLAALPPEDQWLAVRLGDGDGSGPPKATKPIPRPARAPRGPVRLVVVLAISAVLALGLAVTTSGDLAWSGAFILGWGTLGALCLLGGNGATPEHQSVGPRVTALRRTAPRTGWPPTARRFQPPLS